ncbi:MAG: GTP cyclohydrolase [Bacteroidota bacterium]
MKIIEFLRKYSLFILLSGGIFLTGCGDDDDVPEPENELEVITDVKLIFTNVDDASDVVEASAQDPDGEGVEELKISDQITLDVDKTYTLTYEIFNNLETPSEDIGKEILEEDDEHQLFFSFSTDAFASPAGDGNIDTAADPINYDDADENGNPVGLVTTWTTGSATLTGGTFVARLQHQPDVKTATSGADVGDTDFDLEFVLNIQ